MGLDTSHDAWHGAYSAFNRWRNCVAEAAGFTFHKTEYGNQPDLDWGNIEATIGHDLMGEWPAVPTRPDGTPEPLIVLLAHSDCEGSIQVDMLAPLADRLESLLPLLGNADYHADASTASFIAGLRLAAEAGERLEFH